MSSEKPIQSGYVAYQRHCDLGEIRTEKLAGRRCRRKKNGWSTGNKKRLGSSKASFFNLLVI